MLYKAPLIAHYHLVYAASKAILPDGSGQRLANFLWRVWGSEKILYNLTGNQLAAHFSAISEDGPLRTTPTQSPRASRNLSLAARAAKNEAHFLPPQSDAPDEEEYAAGSSTPKPISPPQKDETRDIRPPSILKKPKRNVSPETIEALQENYSASISAQSTIIEDGGDESTPSATPRRNTIMNEQEDRVVRSTKKSPVPKFSIRREGSEIVPPSNKRSSSTLKSAGNEDTIKPLSDTGPKTRRTKTVFHASARKRPVAMKRKSSQSSSSNTPSTISPRPFGVATSLLSSSAASSAVTAESTKSQKEPAMSSTKRAIDLPRSGKSNEAEEDTPKTRATVATSRSRQSPLVEPDFRSKFVEKTRSAQSSFINLPSLLRKPSTTIATSTSHAEGQSAGRGRSKVTFTEGSKPPGPAGPDIGDDDEPPVLPRTKSQLTLLLEKDQRAGSNGQGRKGC